MKAIVTLIIGIFALGGLFILLKPKASQDLSPVEQVQQSVSPTPAPSNVFEFVVNQNKLISGPALIKANQGDEVIIKITSDQPEELHIHGYDKSVELTPNIQTEITFTADLTGRFPFELEHSKTEIGVIEVQPR